MRCQGRAQTLKERGRDHERGSIEKCMGDGIRFQFPSDPLEEADRTKEGGKEREGGREWGHVA